jgi:hypothetical protein
MRKQIRIVTAGVFLFSLVFTLGRVASVPAQAGAPATGTYKAVCLNCHGPFEKLEAASPSYVAPSDEKITPHRYVPHNSKEEKSVPECGNCHQPHPVPPTPGGLAAIAKPDVQWCYTTCHHENNFVTCKKCHK